MSAKVRPKCWIHWNWSYRWLRGTMWGLRAEPWSSREQSGAALNRGAISPVARTVFYFPMHILPHLFLQSWGLNWGILTIGQVSALTLTPNHRSSLSHPVFLCQANTERRVCTSQRKAAWAWWCPAPATGHFSDSFGWCSKLLFFRISLLPAPPNSQACLLDVRMLKAESFLSLLIWAVCCRPWTGYLLSDCQACHLWNEIGHPCLAFLWGLFWGTQ